MRNQATVRGEPMQIDLSDSDDGAAKVSQPPQQAVQSARHTIRDAQAGIRCLVCCLVRRRGAHGEVHIALLTSVFGCPFTSVCATSQQPYFYAHLRKRH